MWTDVRHIRRDELLDWPSSRLRRCDPYLVWAEASTNPSTRPGVEPLDIAVLVELRDKGDYQDFLQRLNVGDPDTLHFLPSGVEQDGTCFITGRVTRTGLLRLVNEVVCNAIDRFTLQDPRDGFGLGGRSVSFLAQLAGIRPRTEEFLASFEPSSPCETELEGLGADRARTYLGVIDDGLPFARMRRLLRDQGTGFPFHLWDQGWLKHRQVQVGDHPTSGIAIQPDDRYWQQAWDFSFFPPSVPLKFRGFFYGRRTQAALQSIAGAEADGDDHDYVLSDYFTPAPRYSHGAAVLGLMAPWLSGAREAVRWPDHICGLAMVQLPTRTVADTSGGSLGLRVLDGLRFILWQEYVDRPRGSDPRPVVVNISYGIHAGPHDGSSMIERAMQEALVSHAHLHLVLPAGNAHRAGCHAQKTLDASGAQETLRLRVLPDNPGDTYVELWVPQGREIKLALRPPGSASSVDIAKGQAWIYQTQAGSAGRTVHFGAIYPDEVAQGKNGTMVLVVIAATRRFSGTGANLPRGLNQQPRADVGGQAGIWELVLTNAGQHPVTVDAWVERGDAPPDYAGGTRQAYFPDSCAEGLGQHNATPEDTLNGISTLQHERAHIVGAMRRDGVLSEYSAAGPVQPKAPDTVRLPTVVTPADWSLNVPGLNSIGFRADAIVRINGTSAACAVYARELARRLAGEAPSELPLPSPRPKEADCTAESQPPASEHLRGLTRREQLPFGVFPIDNLREHLMACAATSTGPHPPARS